MAQAGDVTMIIIPMELKPCYPSGQYVHSFVLHEICDYVLQTNGWTLKGSIFAHVYMLTRYVCQPTFIHIVNDP